MKRKLIETYQEQLIVCDNPECDYVIESVSKDMNEDISMYVNMKCPKCGQNLLTEEDYKLSLEVTKRINFINRWFGWLSIFIKSKTTFNGEIDIKDNKIKVNVNGKL